MSLDAQHSAWHHAVDSRDPAFDGVFYVAITSTRIYCRPVCPSRRAKRENRRFFHSRDEAEAAGYRSCQRCRPELRVGDTPLEAVPRRARDVITHIADGALNEQSVTALASRMGVSERHLRRTLERAVGASPSRLAREQRLRTATELLTTTDRTITRIAFESGFQSLRRFNAAFREQFGMSPTDWRSHGTPLPKRRA